MLSYCEDKERSLIKSTSVYLKTRQAGPPKDMHFCFKTEGAEPGGLFKTEAWPEGKARLVRFQEEGKWQRHDYASGEQDNGNRICFRLDIQRQSRV